MFYDVYAELCKQRNVSESKVAETIGLNRSAVVKWKKGATPAGPTIQKLADYFCVTIDYLLTGEQKEKAPAPKDDREIGDDDIKFALFGGSKDISDEMFEEVKNFAEYVKQREKNKKK